MSVPAGERKESKAQFLFNAYKMNDAIIQFLIKDFGAKVTVRSLKTFCYNARMSGVDAEHFKNLCQKYDIDVESKYPYYVLEYYRTEVIRRLSAVIDNITQANTIYPTSIYECDIRRNYQWKAISECYLLLETLQSAIRILQPKHIDKYMPYVDMISKEIDLLRRWKKSDNKVRQVIIQKEREKEYNRQIADQFYNLYLCPIPMSSSENKPICPIIFMEDNTVYNVNEYLKGRL